MSKLKLLKVLFCTLSFTSKIPLKQDDIALANSISCTLSVKDKMVTSMTDKQAKAV